MHLALAELETYGIHGLEEERLCSLLIKTSMQYTLWQWAFSFLLLWTHTQVTFTLAIRFYPERLTMIFSAGELSYFFPKFLSFFACLLSLLSLFVRLQTVRMTPAALCGRIRSNDSSPADSLLIIQSLLWFRVSSLLIHRCWLVGSAGNRFLLENRNPVGPPVTKAVMPLATLK